MLFAIHAIDSDTAADARKKNYDAHHAFLRDCAAHGVSIVMSGPLVGHDGITPVGSLLIIDAVDLDAATFFHKADPFYAAGVWSQSRVDAFLRKH